MPTPKILKYFLATLGPLNLKRRLIFGPYISKIQNQHMRDFRHPFSSQTLGVSLFYHVTLLIFLIISFTGLSLKVFKIITTFFRKVKSVEQFFIRKNA